MSQELYLRLRRPLLAGATVITLLVALIAIPPLRTTASQFLDIFRVNRIQVVTFDPEQVLNPESVKERLFDRIVIEEVEEQEVASADEAATLVGHAVLVPEYVPTGYNQVSFSVTPRHTARAWVNIPLVRSLLEAAELPTDVLPNDPDENVIHANIPPVVDLTYSDGEQPFKILQSTSPQVKVPEGMDVEYLGEIGLRMLGYPLEEAQRLSRSIDWATTLVVPVPLGEGTTREISLHGVAGYVFTGYELDEPPHGSGEDETLVIWKEGDILYAVAGVLPEEELVHIAESLR